jgi:hypothetical protein
MNTLSVYNTTRYKGKLFLADQDAVQNEYRLKGNKITCAVAVMKLTDKPEIVSNISNKLKKRFKENHIEVEFEEKRDFMRIELEDIETEDISRYFIKACRYLNSMLKQGRFIAVFCNRAASGSPAIIAAFFIWKFRMSYQEAIKYIETFRGKLRINKSFQVQLQEWDYFCKMKVEQPVIV